MVNRRDFVAGSAALAALTVVPIAHAESRSSVAGSRRVPSLAIADRTLPEAAAFLTEAKVAGAMPRLFDRDVGALWMREIEPQLRAGPIALAGLTGEGTLFCLEMLARDYGVEVVERAPVAGGVRWLLATHPERRAALMPSRLARSA